MDDDRFKKLVEEALKLLPEDFTEKLSNVSVTVADFPTDYQLRKARISQNSLLLGLYEGVPQTKRGIYYSNIPDKITIFKNAVLQVCQTNEEIKEQVKKTVIHEIGHHFGLSDEQMK